MIFRILPIVYLIVANLSPAITQDLSSHIELKYGLDYELINGTQFYYQYHRVKGHPYYKSEELVRGGVIQNGKRYGDVKINYDIYSQYLILEYQDNQSGTYRIILSPLHTNAFELDAYKFEKLSLDEKGPLFYQLIKDNGLTCYIHWKKELIQTSNNPDQTDAFSFPELTYYLDYQDALYPLKNRKTFTAPFPDIHRRKIKKYLRRNMIRFKWATPEQIEDLLKYVSSLIQPAPEN